MKLSFKYTIKKAEKLKLDIINDLQWHVKKVSNMLLYDIREGKEKIEVKSLNFLIPRKLRKLVDFSSIKMIKMKEQKGKIEMNIVYEKEE